MTTSFSSKTYIEPLDDTNWETWSFLVEQYLIVNDLWDIVNGTLTEPTDTTEKAAFIRKQKSARAIIALRVSPSQLSAVRLETDPKKIWDELHRLNRPGGFGTRIALRRKLARMRKDPKTPMSKWITSVRDVVCQIKDLGGDVPDEEVIVILTNSLPESYAPLVNQLDTMAETDCTINHVITRLIGEERCQARDKDREKGQEGVVTFLAARRKRRDPSEVTCYACGKKGHYRTNCPETQGNGENHSRKAGSTRSGTLY
jgi:hypothetical protein